jgi:phosphatidylserine decarboxylase
MPSQNTGKPAPRIKDALVLGALGLVPRNLLSRATGFVAHAPLPRPLTTAAIAAFAKRYGIDVAEADRPLGEYPTLGDFFTRRLKSGARVIDRRPGVAVSPADGRVLTAGRLDGETLLQVKGRPYSVRSLLGDDAEAEPFIGGSWATIYLSPRDYHRVHFPTEGKVVGARYVSGTLWPVNRAAVEQIDRLFCVNERVITYVEGPLGRVAVVMVGATNVGHITVAYDEALQANRNCPAGARQYEPPVRVARGDELGTFHLGSTVVLLFADQSVELTSFGPDQPVRMGEAIARRS